MLLLGRQSPSATPSLVFCLLQRSVCLLLPAPSTATGPATPPSPHPQASAFIRQFDMDGDDRINFDEYLLFQVRALAFLLSHFVGCFLNFDEYLLFQVGALAFY